MTVYLIHLSSPIGHAHHYLGWTKADTVEERSAKHKSGCGARLLAVANELGIDYSVVRTWTGDRKLERKLKNGKNSPLLCPVCNPNWRNRGKTD